MCTPTAAGLAIGGAQAWSSYGSIQAHNTNLNHQLTSLNEATIQAYNQSISEQISGDYQFDQARQEVLTERQRTIGRLKAVLGSQDLEGRTAGRLETVAETAATMELADIDFNQNVEDRGHSVNRAQVRANALSRQEALESSKISRGNAGLQILGSGLSGFQAGFGIVEGLRGTYQRRYGRKNGKT